MNRFMDQAIELEHGESPRKYGSQFQNFIDRKHQDGMLMRQVQHLNVGPLT